MAGITPEQFTRQLLQDWASEVENILLAEIRQQLGRVPGETLANLRMEVLRVAAADGSATAYLRFQDSGRHVDMRRLDYRQRAITRGNDFIMDWVRKQGLQKFKFVPGYSNQNRITLSKEKQERRIASAIIASRGSRIKRGSRRKRAKWFNQNFYEQVQVLIRRILDEQADYILETTKQDIRQAFSID